MSYIEEKLKQANGLTLHIIPTKKFKTNTIVLKFLAPLKEEDVTLRALLPYVLQRGNENFPTSTKLRQHLDDLYGASLNVDLAKKGEYHIISFRMDIANEKFLTDQTPLLEHAVQLLSDIILNPLTDGEGFVENIVNEEKRTLKQRIQSVYDDKMRYSNLRLVQEMCKGEPYELHVNGEISHLNDINRASLYEYYQKILKEDKIDLYVVGDVNEEQIETYVNKYFSFTENKALQPTESKEKKVAEVKEVIEEQDVKQGKLNIGYRTNITYRDDDYYALQLFNGIFGGFSHSKLFINVREKESLAYYAASRVESHKGILMVMSGIESKNFQKAVTIINEQMEAMKKGDFTDIEFEQTKAVIRNQLLETIDTSYGLIEVLYHNVVAHSEKSFDEYLDGIANVTREEVIKIGEKIEQDTIYFLKGMGDQA